MHHIISLLIQTVATMTQHGSLTVSHNCCVSQPYWRPLREALEGLGFTFFGAGHFAFVMGHPELPEQAIKVGLKVEDSGAAYAAYCRMKRKEGNHPHLPDIIETYRLDGFYVIQMERLLSLGSFGMKSDFYGDDYLKARKAFWAAHRALYNLYPNPEDLEHQGVVDAAKGIREFFYGIAELDLHEDNAMVRKDGTLVITDPVSYTMAGLREAREAREASKKIQAHKLQMARLMPSLSVEEIRQKTKLPEWVMPTGLKVLKRATSTGPRSWAYKLNIKHPFSHNKP